LLFGAQAGNEGFFERIGFARGMTSFVGRIEDIRNAGEQPNRVDSR
jgi:hypothetical protein